MKLMERDYENFTPDFVARKSVFCFDNGWFVWVRE